MRPIRSRLFLWIVVVCATVGSLHAQPMRASQEDPDFGTGLGIEILLTNSGFGLGGYYHHALAPNLAPFVEIQMRSGKHESEAVFSTLFGQRIIPDKYNFLMMLPMHAGVQYRLFSDEIASNFRPYVQVAVGPALGWEYPYFDDCNGNGEYDLSVDCDGDGVTERERTLDFFTGIWRGELRYGMGGIISIGAFFGTSSKYAQGVRIGYAFNYFSKEIQLLESASQHYFGSPIITFQFGRVY